MHCGKSPARRRILRAPALTLARAAELIAALLLASAPLTVLAAPPAGGHTGPAHIVSIEGMRFSPQTLHVRRGERITWVNKDPFPHTVTASNGQFDSHQIAAGGSWTYVARKAGAYDYACTLHVGMKGRLQVR